MDATIGSVLMGAVVYFLVVGPYIKPKERLFPAESEGIPLTSPCLSTP